MKNKTYRSVLFMSASIALVCATAPAYAETLYEAVYKALTSHPSIQAARQERDAAKDGIREQRSSYYPDINVNASGGRIYGDNSTSRGLTVSRGAGYSGLWEGNASLSQRVWDWGETSARVDAAIARTNLADSGLNFTQDQIAMRTVEAYVGLVRASALKDYAEKHLAAMTDYRTRVAAQVGAGGADESALNRANDFLLIAQNAAIDFDSQYQQARANYEEAVGAPPQAALDRPALPLDIPASLDDALARARTDNAQVKAAEDAIVAAKRDTDATGTEILPRISTQLSYTERDQRDVIGGELTDGRALMRMDWSYATGGAQLARKSKAEHTRAKAESDLLEILRTIERDVRVAWSGLDAAKRQRDIQESRYKAMQELVATYRTQYEGAEKSIMDLMQAETQAFDASVTFTNADYSHILANYTLVASTGRLIASFDRGTIDTALQGKAP